MCENPILYVPNNKIVPSENTDSTTWCPKPGSNRHVFLRTLDFESNASTNSAIRANGLRKNASNRLDFAKILQKAELSKCGKFK